MSSHHYPLFLFVNILLFFGTTVFAQDTFDCRDLKGVCTPPPAAAAGTDRCNINKDKGEIYCPYFQCDSGGNVLLQNGGAQTKLPNVSVFGNTINTGLLTITINGKVTKCYTNCCYEEDECGSLVGQINTQPSCQNKCCPTLEGYLNGECVENTCQSASSFEAGEEVSDDLDSPLFGDLDGDGEL